MYPVTPASPIGEHSDDWAAANRPSLWALVPEVGSRYIQTLHSWTARHELTPASPSA